MGRQLPAAAEALLRGDAMLPPLSLRRCFPPPLATLASADSDTDRRTVARTAALPPSLTCSSKQHRRLQHGSNTDDGETLPT